MAKEKLYIAEESSKNTADKILNSLSEAILSVDSQQKIIFANAAAEQLLGSSYVILSRKKLTDIVPQDSPIVSLVEQSISKNAVVSEYDINIGNPIIGNTKIDVHVSPLIETDDIEENGAVIQFQQRTIAQKINQQKHHRNAARSVSGMAAMLAHEIKNPLSGIKGSAQILSQDISKDDVALTDLIIDEVDRICKLVDRMEVFTDHRQIEREEINIHSVLEHVKKLAENGFGKHVKFVELYDPSLPNTLGDHGSLIQVFLNLLKNAAEAVTENDGQITITTAYRLGMRVASANGEEFLNLPLEITIIDNGGGIDDTIKEDIFDPFVTTKSGGSGLGLALVAKIISDHGGVIECESDEGKTIFRVLLPSALKGNHDK
ncbi:MAG: ATP-binding protein [Emcibacteraceae bacterium]|jgi:two-component system nitrogen regulation sensor histidine kinase GlnL|nr:ATP-binding protein [Emcibacteraceae bacterium]MDG1727846.1 ATP-binding protein [Emcibacteraceae bacterium]